MRTIIGALVLLGAAMATSAPAQACMVPPDHMYISHEDSIHDAEWIAHVRTARVDGDVGWGLEVIEYLKGDGPELIVFPDPPTTVDGWRAFEPASASWVDQGHVQISRFSSMQRSKPANFYNHNGSDFWANGGRGFNAPDCTIRPVFNAGGDEYLVFGPLDYNVGFEALGDENDAWLAFVRDHLATGSAGAPFPVDADEYLGSMEAVVRIQARLEGDSLNFEETVLFGEVDSYLTTLFVLPELELKDELMCARQRPWASGDANQIDRIYFIERHDAPNVHHAVSLRCSREVAFRNHTFPRPVTIEAFGRFATRRVLTLNVREGDRIDLRESNNASRRPRINLEDVEAILTVSELIDQLEWVSQQ